MCETPAGDILKMYRPSRLIEICLKSPGLHVIANDSEGISVEVQIREKDDLDLRGWDGEYLFYSDSLIAFTPSRGPRVHLLLPDDRIEEIPRKKCRR